MMDKMNYFTIQRIKKISNPSVTWSHFALSIRSFRTRVQYVKPKNLSCSHSWQKVVNNVVKTADPNAN